jgi:hypothetical protein
MRTFKNTCAQGDVYIRRVDSLPEGLVEVAPENGVNIVTHSETGHNHVMEATASKLYSVPGSEFDCYLSISAPTTLNHLRDHDTHEPIFFDIGTYHVRRQREYTPEGFRKAQD